MEYLPLIIVVIVGPLLAVRPFTVLFHELGHAIPAIILSREKVAIYIGSYGDPNGSLNLNLELLEIWFKYNPFLWRQGLCVPYSKNISINKQIIYTLTGPITSFFIAAIASYLTFEYDLHGAIKLILLVFLGSSIFDLLINLIPRSTPIKLFDGRETYNDGYSLKLLFYYRGLHKDYPAAVDFYNKKEYGEAARLFDSLLANVKKDVNIYRLAISSYVQIKNFIRVKELSDQFTALFRMNANDYVSAGFAYSQLNFHEKAYEFYEEALKLDPKNKYALSNKGYTLNLQTKYDEAITIFNRAIEIDSTMAHSFSGRGLAKTKMGKLEDGLQDINHSIELDPANSYGYLNLGTYHFDRNEYSEALRLFKKAKEIDPSTHMVNDMILKAEESLITIGS